MGGDFSIIMMVFMATILIVNMALIAKTYHKVAPNQALIRTGVGGTHIIRDGGFVFPVMHQAEIIDLSEQQLVFKQEGKQGVFCKDYIKVDIEMRVRVQVNPEEIVKVAQNIGSKRAIDHDILYGLFSSQILEALKSLAKQMDFTQLYQQQAQLANLIKENMGTDLHGYLINAISIESLTQTPIAFLDPDNILDAKAIERVSGKA